MSQENVDIVMRGYERFRATGGFDDQIVHPDFMWDMSNYSGWPEQQTYPGLEGAQRFMRDWIDAWDDWEWEVRSLHDAGDKVVAVMHQSGRSKSTGVRVEMDFAQVFTLREGRPLLMEMYADPGEALRAVGVGK
jgi:ketosteroid isomerase-like protein